ncbi:MAG: MerR family transcriptional regulator [Candidatus Onthomonas sp.]
MLKIGDFSKLARVSIRMLRHYDEIGLLKPVEIDPFTGYRYYSERQLPTACRITALKDMGFSLAAIRAMLGCYDNPALLEGYLLAHQAELNAQMAETAYRLRLLDTALEGLRKGKNMNYDVTLKTIPQRYAACLRMTIPRYQEEGVVWNILCEETDQLNLVPDDPCLCSVLFHDGEWKETDVDIEAQKTVRGTYPDTEHVKFQTLPPVTVASAIYRGSYELIGEVYAAVAGWAEANGYACCGPMFNIYHVSPHETQNPQEFVTEVCYPVRQK